MYVVHWGKPRQEPGGGSWSRGCGGVLLTGFLPLAYSAFFLYNPWPPAQGWHCPERPELIHINHESRKCPWLAHRSSDGSIFSAELPIQRSLLVSRWQRANKRQSQQEDNYKLFPANRSRDLGEIYNPVRKSESLFKIFCYLKVWVSQITDSVKIKRKKEMLTFTPVLQK